MEAEFWVDSWNKGGTATSFHRGDVHPYLVKHLPPEFLRGKNILVPLCGKSNDLTWFRDHGAHVWGIELVDKAIQQFFAEQEISYTQPTPQRYEAERLTILNQDFFSITPEIVGRVDLVYDRAALVALPSEMRMRYIAQINRLVPPGGQQFINTLEYAPTLPTPPFSITPQDIQRYYGAEYRIEQLESPTLPEHRMVAKFNLDFLKEHAFLLTRKG